MNFSLGYAVFPALLASGAPIYHGRCAIRSGVIGAAIVTGPGTYIWDNVPLYTDEAKESADAADYPLLFRGGGWAPTFCNLGPSRCYLGDSAFLVTAV